MIRPGLVILLALTPLLLHAQSPADRDRLFHFRDSLASQTDTAALARLERGLIEEARHDRDNPLRHLTLGFLALRLGELGEAAIHYEDAASEFEWAAELSPEWPFPWYGLGLAEFALLSHPLAPSITLNRLRRVLNVDEASHAAAAQRKALTADPDFGPALTAMISIAIAEANPSELAFALAAARRIATGPPAGTSQYWYDRGVIERNYGSEDSALIAFEQFRRTGGDESLGLLELARTNLFMGNTEPGIRQYFAALTSPSSNRAWTLLRADLAWIASADDLQAFDSLGGDGRRRWVERFWSDRDFATGRPPHARLAEHYRRIAYAERNFRTRSTYRQVDRIYPYQADQQWLDDRGVIYIRHGEPSQMALYVGPPGTIPNVSWKYRWADSSAILHFRPQGDVAGIGGYRLVESLFDIGATAEMLESRGGLDPIYDQLAMPNPSQRLLYLEREWGYQAIVKSTATDSYVLSFERQLRSVVSGYGLGLDRNRGRVLITLAVPLADLTRGQGASPGPIQLLDLSVSVRADDGAISRLDTVIPIRVDPSQSAAALATAAVVLPLAPGEYQLTVVGSANSRRAGFARNFPRLRVPNLNRFELSDIILGTRESGVTWFSGDQNVALNPGNAYSSARGMQVYYEVGGLQEGQSYRTTVELLEHQRTGRPLIALAFTENATSTSMVFQRSLGLEGTKSGAYRIRITLTGPDGQTTSRESSFEVE